MAPASSEKVRRCDGMFPSDCSRILAQDAYDQIIAGILPNEKKGK